MTTPAGAVVRRADVPPVRWTREQGRFLLRAQDTGGMFSLLELNTPPGGGPPPHCHDDSDETFHVLDGRYEIRLGEQTHTVGPGDTVFGPRGVAHGFRNVGPETGRLLCVATPGGMEEMFEGLAEIMAAPGPPDRAAIADLVARHRVHYL